MRTTNENKLIQALSISHRYRMREGLTIPKWMQYSLCLLTNSIFTKNCQLKVVYYVKRNQLPLLLFHVYMEHLEFGFFNVSRWKTFIYYEIFHNFLITTIQQNFYREKSFSFRNWCAFVINVLLFKFKKVWIFIVKVKKLN